MRRHTLTSNGRGAVGYITRTTERPQNHLIVMIANSPTVKPLAVFLFHNQQKGVRVMKTTHITATIIGVTILQCFAANAATTIYGRASGPKLLISYQRKNSPTYYECTNGEYIFDSFTNSCISVSYNNKTGNGTNLSPYKIDCLNPQKTTQYQYCSQSAADATCRHDQKMTINGCEDCPDGFSTNDYQSSHNSITTCDTCKQGYYNKNGAYTQSCTKCPDGGTTAANDYSGMTRTITACYLPDGSTGSDTTGTFIITGENCYYTD